MDAISSFSFFAWVLLVTVLPLTLYVESSVLGERVAAFERLNERWLKTNSFGRRLLQYDLNEEKASQLPPKEPNYIDPLENENSTDVTSEFAEGENKPHPLEKSDGNAIVDMNTLQRENVTESYPLNNSLLLQKSNFSMDMIPSTRSRKTEEYNLNEPQRKETTETSQKSIEYRSTKIEDDADYSDYAKESSESYSYSYEPLIKTSFPVSYYDDDNYSKDTNVSINSTDAPLTVDSHVDEQVKMSQVDGNRSLSFETLTTNAPNENDVQDDVKTSIWEITTQQIKQTNTPETIRSSVNISSASLVNEHSPYHDEENEISNSSLSHLPDGEGWSSEAEAGNIVLPPEQTLPKDDPLEENDEIQNFSTSTVTSSDTTEFTMSSFQDLSENTSTSYPFHRAYETQTSLENETFDSKHHIYEFTESFKNKEYVTPFDKNETVTVSSFSDNPDFQTPQADQKPISSEYDVPISTTLNYGSSELSNVDEVTKTVLNASYSEPDSLYVSYANGAVTSLPDNASSDMFNETEDRIELPKTSFPHIYTPSFLSTTQEIQSGMSDRALEQSVVSETMSLGTTTSTMNEAQSDNGTIILPNVEDTYTPIPADHSTTEHSSSNEELTSMSYTERTFVESGDNSPASDTLITTEHVNSLFETSFKGWTLPKEDIPSVTIPTTFISIIPAGNISHENLTSTEKQNDSSNLYFPASTPQLQSVDQTPDPVQTQRRMSPSTKRGYKAEHNESTDATSSLHQTSTSFQRSFIISTKSQGDSVSSETLSKLSTNSSSTLISVILSPKFQTSPMKTFNSSFAIGKRPSALPRKATSSIFHDLVSTTTLPRTTSSASSPFSSLNIHLLLPSYFFLQWLLSLFFRWHNLAE